MAKIIGLTGGIATGKSTVTQMFKERNIPVIDSDKIAKTLLDKGQEAYQEILAEFGEEVLSTDTNINRNKLAKIIFNDEKKRKKLNEIVHPKVKKVIYTEIARLKTLEHDFIVVDVPLLFESEFDKICDITLLVFARRKDQVTRLMMRDHIDETYALQKIKSQFPLGKKKALADYVIDNSKSILETRKAFDKFISSIRGETNGH
ncbi:dephospho-CoA kinase [Liberiplasma polymorphum]|uniref:dephospho-CoA kinase n=1 Tax=Liberiplasma polymorphum TaxID=3374570 RepID=UPI003772BD4A